MIELGLVESRFYVDLPLFQSYLDLEAGDTQSPKWLWQDLVTLQSELF